MTVAGFAFDPQTFAPTYRLVYGAPGRSLAIEMAQRLGMPLSVVAAARGFLSDDQKRLQAHLDRDRRAGAGARCRDDAAASASAARSTSRSRRWRQRERALAEREERFKKRLNEKLDERLRQARRDIDRSSIS